MTASLGSFPNLWLSTSKYKEVNQGLLNVKIQNNISDIKSAREHLNISNKFTGTRSRDNFIAVNWLLLPYTTSKY